MSLSTTKELSSNVIYYTVYLLSNDVITKGYDVLFTVRKNYFENKKKKKDRVFLNINGESVKFNYLIDNNKPLKWTKENEKVLTQKVSVNGSNNYIIETLDFSGALVKNEYFNNSHIYEKSEYFDGFSKSPYKTIIPLITDKVATIALYIEESKKPITLKSVVMPLDNNILNDLVLEVSPEVGANTSEGFSYFCSEEKEKKWNKLLSNYRDEVKINVTQEEKPQIKKERFVFNADNLTLDASEIEFDIKKSALPMSKYKKNKVEMQSQDTKEIEIQEETNIEIEELNEDFEIVEKIENRFVKELEDIKELEELEDIKEEKFEETEEKIPDKEIKENSREKNLYYGKLDSKNNRIGYGRTTTSSGKTLYDGEYLNDKQNGFGVSYYKTGRLNYIGNWLDDKKDGFGISVRPTDGCVQVGAFKNDKLEDVTVKFDKSGKLMYIENYKKDDLDGSHISIEDDGNMIVTKWEDGKIQKNATILSNKGDLIYSGGVKNNKKDGRGMLFTQEVKLLYKGEFKNDEYNGKGILYLENGATIEGEFKNNKANGKAIQRDENYNVVYDGYFKDNKYDGNGKLFFENGTYKVGEFRQGQPIGDFILYSKEDKKLYKGQLTQDVFDGKGTIYNDELITYSGAFSNGEKFGLGREFEKGVCVFMGEFEDGIKNGFGTTYINNQPEYIGYFKDDKKCGYGILYGENQTLFVGEFKDDVMNGRINIGRDKKVYEQCIYENGECVYSKKYSEDATLIYDGNIKNNIKEGMGCTFNEFSDKEFEGIFKDDKPHKSMKVISKQLSDILTTDKLNSTQYKEYIKAPLVAVEIPMKNGIYSGQLNAENKPCGKGVMLCCDHKYMGNFKNGKPSGEATIIFDDGEEKNVYVEESKTEDSIQIKFTNIIYHIKN